MPYTLADLKRDAKEELLAEATPEELLAHVPMEKRLEGIPLQRLLASLPPEARAELLRLAIQSSEPNS
ncbi:MAG: hypothetical protein K2W96_03850 [Gemmataceae bacterium]|nr:hypothetical protein [Gemmataceae bacterium]